MITTSRCRKNNNKYITWNLRQIEICKDIDLAYTSKWKDKCTQNY